MTRYNFQVPPDQWRTFTVGERIRFTSEKQAYTVRGTASGGRYVVLTKPFNPRRTVLYTIIDQARGIRGVDNCHGLGYETPEQIERALSMFEDGDAEVSWRSGNHIPLDLADQPVPA